MTKTTEFALGKGSAHVLPVGTITAPIRESRLVREQKANPKAKEAKEVPALLKDKPTGAEKKGEPAKPSTKLSTTTNSALTSKPKPKE